MALTQNHRHAIALARQILSDEHAADQITDADWALLLLAADVNRCDSAPRLVARRVLEAFEKRSGYFDFARIVRDPVAVVSPTTDLGVAPALDLASDSLQWSSPRTRSVSFSTTGAPVSS